ncbi:hypothetical protein BaRGS_00018283 [Batillaria attramentaria]|uniref:Uncharacterized protein n=1 Tax=Batillaria attramentaria TaxID=370345 RepID=A0ABD0KUN5_9CAEN
MLVDSLKAVPVNLRIKAVGCLKRNYCLTVIGRDKEENTTILAQSWPEVRTPARPENRQSNNQHDHWSTKGVDLLTYAVNIDTVRTTTQSSRPVIQSCRSVATLTINQPAPEPIKH